MAYAARRLPADGLEGVQQRVPQLEFFVYLTVGGFHFDWISGSLPESALPEDSQPKRKVEVLSSLVILSTISSPLNPAGERFPPRMRSTFTPGAKLIASAAAKRSSGPLVST